MQLKPITAIIVLSLVVASLLVTGCTNPIQQVQNAVTPQNKAVDYANAFVNYTKNNNTDSNVTFTSVKVSENGTDQARISITSVNTTKNTSSLWSNGSTTTYALNVKKFDSTDAATKFYDDQSFGYSAISSANLTTSFANPNANIYAQVMGHDSTLNQGAIKIGNFNFISISASFIIQQSEFVTWGDVSVMAGSSA